VTTFRHRSPACWMRISPCNICLPPCSYFPAIPCINHVHFYSITILHFCHLIYHPPHILFFYKHYTFILIMQMAGGGGRRLCCPPLFFKPSASGITTAPALLCLRRRWRSCYDVRRHGVTAAAHWPGVTRNQHRSKCTAVDGDTGCMIAAPPPARYLCISAFSSRR